MDTFTLSLIGLGALSVGLVACGVYARQLAERLGAQERRTAEAIAERDEARAQLAEAQRREEAAELERAELSERARELTARAERDAAARAQLEGALQTANAAYERRVRGVESRLQLAERSLKDHSEQLEAAGRHLRVASSTLAALGVPPMDQRWSPVASAARPASRAAIRALMLDGQASSVCVADARGLPILQAGEPLRAASLAAFSASLRALEAPIRELFGAPVASLSVIAPTRAVHRLALPVDELWLCLEGAESTPELAMRLAAAKICGQPGVSPEHLRVLESLSSHDKGGAAQERLSLATLNTPQVWGEPIDGEPALLDWARGQGASAAWVLDADEQLMLSTVRSLNPLQGLRAGLAPLWARAARDQQALDRLEVHACADDGRCLGLRLAEDRLDAPLIVALSATRLAPGALDSLDAAVRWRLNTTSLHPVAAGGAR